MSAAKHTPGPWSVSVETRPHSETSWYVTAPDPDSRGGAIEVPFHIGLAGGNQRTLQSGRTEANARLIAAAPDMFEALTCLLAAIEPGGFSLEDLRGEMADANAALKKARGES